MNTKLLKQKILDLAIRGKLTQQLKSDGNTADLLKEISSACHPERSAKGAKSKDFKQIIPLDKSEVPFEVPANWEWVRLPDVCSIPITDGTHQTPTYSNKEDGIPFLSAKDVTTQKIVWDKIKYITKSLHEELCLRIAPKRNDILLAKNGTTGVAALVETDIVFDIYVTLAVLRPRKIVNPRFLLYFVNGPVAKAQFDASLKGVGVPNLHLSEINKVVLPLPPLAEQQRIVAKIEEAFAEIDAIEKNKELLKAHVKQTRQKILDLAIHGKLVPQNKSDEPASVLLERITRDNPHYEKLTDAPFEIPDSWEWVKLGDVAALKGGKRVPAGKTMTTEPTSHIYIRVTDMRDGTIYDDDLHYITDEIYEVIKNYTISKKDLYITIAGTIGRVGLVPDFFDGMNLTENALKVTEIAIEKKYLMFVLQSRFVQEYFESTYHQVAMPKLSLVNASKAVIPLPPLAEQKRIVDRIEEIFASLDEISLHLI